MVWHRCLTWGALLQLPGTSASPQLKELGCNGLAQGPHLGCSAAMAWYRRPTRGALLLLPDSASLQA